MATQPAKAKNLLYLEQITLQGVLNREYTLSLFVENKEREVQTKDGRTWTPTQRPCVSPTSKMRVAIQMRSGHLFWAKNRQAHDMIDLQEIFDGYWSSSEREFTVPKLVVIGKHHWSLELRFSADTTAESLRSSLNELEGLLMGYSTLMTGSMERAVEKGIKFGAVFAELNPITKAIFGVASVAFEVLKEQNQYDQMPSGLLDRLKRILPLANKVADEIVCEETEILEEIVPRMFNVMHRVAKFSCDYVKRVKMSAGLGYQEMIEEMDKELTKVIEDFERAVNVEALRLAKETEQKVLLGQLKSVEAGYDLERRCMEGTRQFILNHVMAWVTNPQETNTYWLYGSPGIGKTSLAHSICEKLHNQKLLAGAFFCRRDDPDLSELRNILPTLINALARTFPPFRSIVADRLRNDQNLTSKSMNGSLFLDFIRSLPRQPKHPLVFVIDALDECGNTQSRPGVLKVLTAAAAQAPWLKVIITSRPEVDIQRFFDASNQPSHLQYDLMADQEASDDLRTFARDQLNSVAAKWHLSTPWPEESLFNRVISHANGLFIFIKTFVLTLEKFEDPEECLEATLQDSAGTGLEPLYGLYSSILREQIVHTSISGFQQMIGVLLVTAPHRPLGEEPIAKLAGVKRNLVEKWVDDLSSLLYRDKGGIRVRHLSISDFFLTDRCEYRVNLQEANAQLGIACLKTMVEQLRFNICKLEDSRLANADVEDLPSRIKENISDALQYSSLYWSDHLCFTPDNGDQREWGSLKEFFGGLYPLFWIEALSIMGMVPIGAPSLRRVMSWVKVSGTPGCRQLELLDADATLLERIQDVCRFVLTFHIPISISAPHTYISTQPFLPSQSALSATFSTWFTNAIKMQRGKLFAWPASPLQWIGHTSAVTSISYSPNGTHIATGSRDKTILIWDADTGTVVGGPLVGHTEGVESIAYSPDGRQILSGSKDATIRIWDAKTGAIVGKPLDGHTDAVFSVAYRPDGQHIVSGSDDKTIRIWDTETGAAVGKPLMGHTASVICVAYSPDGRSIISGSGDRTVRIWGAEASAGVSKSLKGHEKGVNSIAYSPDGRRIISGSDDNTIRIWDAETGDVVGEPLKGHNRSVFSVAYSSDGHHIISGCLDGTIRIWDAETGAAVGRPLTGHTGCVHIIAFSPDGKYIISGSHDYTVRLWDAKTGDTVGKPPEGHAESVWSVAYSPDGQHIISGSEDNTIRIWDAKTGAAIGGPLVGHTDSVLCVAYSPEGRHITSGSMDCTIRIWDAETGNSVGGPLQGHTEPVVSVIYSPDGQYITSGSWDETIRIWDAETGSAVGTPLYGHTGSVHSVAYSPDGQYIASGSGDNAIQIWDVKTGAAVGEPLDGHTKYVSAVAYSPNGRRIISGSNDTTVRVWDAETGLAVGKPLEGHTHFVESIAYSPSGQHIVSGSLDGTIRLWDAETGAAVGNPLEGHSSSVTSIAYSPDGRRIISGGDDSTIRIWDADTSAAVEKRLDSNVHNVKSIDYSPRGRHFVTGSGDNTIYGLNPSPIKPSTSYNPIRAAFFSSPDSSGWVRDSEGGLLYWVPAKYHRCLNSPALLTIPLTSDTCSISLDFEDVAFGLSWTQIFKSTQL